MGVQPTTSSLHATHMVVLASNIHSCKLQKNLSSQIYHFYTPLKKSWMVLLFDIRLFLS